MKAARSLLYVPGSRPERFEKAAATGADIVCVDLEDAVGPGDKPAARINALDYLAGERRRPTQWAIRINSPRTALGIADLAILLERGAAPDLLVTPKTQSGDEARMLHEIFGGRIPLCPMIETPEGLAHAYDIASAPSVAGLMFGGVDFSAEMGVPQAWEPLLFARSTLAAACGRAGCWLLDGPATDVADLDALAQTTARSRDLGFTGRSCIHPTQVPVIHAAYTPAEADVAWARRVIEAFDAAEGGVALLDGKLIEKPIARAARRTLDRAG